VSAIPPTPAPPLSPLSSSLDTLFDIPGVFLRLLPGTPSVSPYSLYNIPYNIRGAFPYFLYTFFGFWLGFSPHKRQDPALLFYAGNIKKRIERRRKRRKRRRRRWRDC